MVNDFVYIQLVQFNQTTKTNPCLTYKTSKVRDIIVKKFWMLLAQNRLFVDRCCKYLRTNILLPIPHSLSIAFQSINPAKKWISNPPVNGFGNKRLRRSVLGWGQILPSGSTSTLAFISRFIMWVWDSPRRYHSRAINM